LKFTVTRLCGGRALMMVPREDIVLDMDHAVNLLGEVTEDVRRDGLMVLCMWRGLEMTLYEQGKVMFFPLQERSQGIVLATEILEVLASARKER